MRMARGLATISTGASSLDPDLFNKLRSSSIDGDLLHRSNPNLLNLTPWRKKTDLTTGG